MGSMPYTIILQFYKQINIHQHGYLLTCVDLRNL